MSRKRASRSVGKSPQKNDSSTKKKSPVVTWRKISDTQKKPRSRSKARQPETVQDEPQTGFWVLLIRFLPAIALLVMILILEPTLPVRAVGALIDWVGSWTEAPASQAAAEPVFIVEGAEIVTLQDEMPAPTWSLEISPIFTPEVQYWSAEIAQWSLAYRIKPNLIATLIQIESCGDPYARAEDGAVGLFQVPPEQFDNGDSETDPQTNARIALEYFVEMFATANGDLGLALAAYNAGLPVFELSPADWPDETQYYQFLGSGIYEEAEMGLEQSPTLLEWLNSGGDALCLQASETLGLTTPDASETPGS